MVDGPLCASAVRHLVACKLSQLPSGALAFGVSEPCKDIRRMFVQIEVLYGFTFTALLTYIYMFGGKTLQAWRILPLFIPL